MEIIIWIRSEPTQSDANRCAALFKCKRVRVSMTEVYMPITAGVEGTMARCETWICISTHSLLPRQYSDCECTVCAISSSFRCRQHQTQFLHLVLSIDLFAYGIFNWTRLQMQTVSKQRNCVPMRRSLTNRRFTMPSNSTWIDSIEVLIDFVIYLFSSSRSVWFLGEEDDAGAGGLLAYAVQFIRETLYRFGVCFCFQMFMSPCATQSPGHLRSNVVCF